MKIISIIYLKGGSLENYKCSQCSFWISHLKKKVLFVNLDYKPVDFILSPPNVNQLKECDLDLIELFKDNFDIQKKLLSIKKVARVI